MRQADPFDIPRTVASLTLGLSKALRTVDVGGHSHFYRVQFQVWRRTTENLVRSGLGLGTFAMTPELIAHFKRSLRLLFPDGAANISDQTIDKDWNSFATKTT